MSHGHVSCDPDLHLIVDGEIVRPESVIDRVQRFTLPAGAGDVTIASRRVVPNEMEAASLDPRRLGVPVERIVLQGAGLRVEIGQDWPALSNGFHRDETTHRWTDGQGSVPAVILAHFADDLTIELQIGPTDLHYPVDIPVETAAARVDQKHHALHRDAS